MQDATLYRLESDIQRIREYDGTINDAILEQIRKFCIVVNYLNRKIVNNNFTINFDTKHDCIALYLKDSNNKTKVQYFLPKNPKNPENQPLMFATDKQVVKYSLPKNKSLMFATNKQVKLVDLIQDLMKNNKFFAEQIFGYNLDHPVGYCDSKSLTFYLNKQKIKIYSRNQLKTFKKIYNIFKNKETNKHFKVLDIKMDEDKDVLIKIKSDEDEIHNIYVTKHNTVILHNKKNNNMETIDMNSSSSKDNIEMQILDFLNCKDARNIISQDLKAADIFSPLPTLNTTKNAPLFEQEPSLLDKILDKINNIFSCCGTNQKYDIPEINVNDIKNNNDNKIKTDASFLDESMENLFPIEEKKENQNSVSSYSDKQQKHINNKVKKSRSRNKVPSLDSK